MTKNNHFKNSTMTPLTINKEAPSFGEIENFEPKLLVKYMTSNINILPCFLLHLSKSFSFTLQTFQQAQARIFVDLVVLHPHTITNEVYYQAMFDKMWLNDHARQYLLGFVEGLYQVPLLPLPYLKRIITSISAEKLSSNLRDVLKAIAGTRSKEYQTLSS